LNKILNLSEFSSNLNILSIIKENIDNYLLMSPKKSKNNTEFKTILLNIKEITGLKNNSRLKLNSIGIWEIIGTDIFTNISNEIAYFNNIENKNDEMISSDFYDKIIDKFTASKFSVQNTCETQFCIPNPIKQPKIFQNHSKFNHMSKPNKNIINLLKNEITIFKFFKIISSKLSNNFHILKTAPKIHSKLAQKSNFLIKIKLPAKTKKSNLDRVFTEESAPVTKASEMEQNTPRIPPQKIIFIKPFKIFKMPTPIQPNPYKMSVIQPGKNAVSRNTLEMRSSQIKTMKARVSFLTEKAEKVLEKNNPIMPVFIEKNDSIIKK